MSDLNFLFSFGNSTDGPIGMCVRVWAKTKAEAVAKLRACLPEELPVKSHIDSTSVEYANVYLNPEAITEADIDSVEDEDGKEVAV